VMLGRARIFIDKLLPFWIIAAYLDLELRESHELGNVMAGRKAWAGPT
jgi:hypothetical protein